MATVKEAIKKGRTQLVHIPIALLMSGIAIACLLLMNERFVWAGISVVLGIALAWLYWSWAVTRWRIWAFGNVRNVHELRRKAIRLKLIWPSGGFFEKTEIRNAAQKRELQQLESRFNQPDVYQDDLSVPRETHVYYKKAVFIYELFIWFGLIGFGMWLASDRQWAAIFPLGIGGYLSYGALRKTSDSSVQLVLSNAGIRLKNTTTISWNDVDWGIEVRDNNSTQGFLWISDRKQYGEIDISEIDMKADEIERRIYIYELRAEQNRD